MTFFLGQVVHAYLLLRERDFLRLAQVVDFVMSDCSTNFILERNSFLNERHSCNMWIVPHSWPQEHNMLVF